MKNLIRICAILILSAFLASCAVEETLKLNITNVSLDKKTFNPTKNEKVKIRYRLPKKARTTIRLYGSEYNLVRTIEPKGVDRRGYNERVWDGRNDSGKILPKDVYIYTIEAKDVSKKESYLYDIAGETGGIELALRGLNFDYKTGKIDYILPKAARLRVRIGIKEGGPLLRTLIDCEPREAGRDSIKWDGMDSSKVLNLLGNPNVFVNIAAFSLPENSVILEGNEEPVSSKYHEPLFNLEILDIEDEIIPIRITLDERDKLDLINSRFEIIFFMDYVFFFEEEEGTSPFTYRLDTKGLNEGEHILTVNIYGYEDRISGRTKKLFIKGRK